MACPYPLTESFLSDNPCFRHTHEVSLALYASYDMPWRGPMRLWHKFAIKLITAWNFYHVAVDWPFGDMSHSLQQKFLKQMKED